MTEWLTILTGWISGLFFWDDYGEGAPDTDRSGGKHGR